MYKKCIATLREIQSAYRRISKLPLCRIDVSQDMAMDMGFVNEALDIVLCKIGGQPRIVVPPLALNHSSLELFCSCLKRAKKQTAQLSWCLIARRINLTKDSLQNLYMAEDFIGKTEQNLKCLLGLNPAKH